MVHNKIIRLSREDWLAAALDRLKADGIDGVKVLSLSKHLGVTRGSFYWHFKNRDDLLDAVLTYWAEDSTETVVAHLATVKGDARERLYALMEFVVVTGRTEYDYAIRAWALFDPKAATVVRAVDRRRLGYVNNLFREAGFSAAQATARSRLLADYLIWDEHLTVPESAAKRRRLLRTRWEILTKA